MHKPNLHLSPEHRRRFLQALKILAVVVAVYALLGFFAAPPLVKSFVAHKLGDQIGRRLEFGEVRTNPFALSMTLRNVVLYEPDRKTAMLTVGEVYMNASAASLLRLAPVVTEIRIEQPLARIVRSGENRFNFSDIVDRIRAQPAGGGGAHFALNNMHLRQGRIDYDDQLRQSRHSLSDIDLAIPFLSNLRNGVEIFTKPAFSAKLDGSPLALSGQTRPFAPTHDTALQIDLDGLSLPEFMALLPGPLNFKLASGLLDTRLNIDFHQSGTTGSVVVSGHAAVRQVELQEKSGAPLLQWDRLSVELERAEPFNKLVRLAAVKLEAPVLHASRQQDGALNLLRALSLPSSAPAKPAEAQGEPLRLALARAEISNGQLQWRDAAAGPAGAATLDIKKLDAALTGFNSDGSSAAQVTASVETGAAETLHYEATLAADGKSLQGQLKIAALRPQRLRPYFAGLFAGALGDTLLDATVPHRLAWPERGLALSVQQAEARLRNVQVTLPGQKTPGVAAREIALAGLHFDLGQRSAGADQLTIDAAKVAVERDRHGKIDLLAALSGAAPPEAKTATPKQVASKPAAAPAAGWQLALKHLKVEQSELRFSDALVAAQNGGKPASQQLGKLNLALDDIALRVGAPNAGAPPPPFPLSLNATYGQRGSVNAKGTLSLQPLHAVLQLDAQRLDITAFQPYFADRSNATFTSGAVNANGKLMLQMPEQKPLRLSYAGTLSLNGVRTRDRLTGDDFARWKSLSFAHVDARLNTEKTPVVLALGDVAVADFYARIIVNPNGRLNLQDIVATPGAGQTAPTTSLTQVAPPSTAAAAAPAPAGPAPLVRIGHITLQGGNINFSDNFVKPNYSANLTGMSGSVSKLASDEQTPADVLMKGKLDGDAPVEISGKLNPLASQLYLDLAASARGIELTRLTPYAAKYAGYSITKGKLSADVKYHVENGKLEAQNRLFLDQLTFGDKVESPDATKLPVLLAVALLRNSRGEIDLNLPVSGSLSDPEFSVGGVLLRALVNVLTKAITAPFSLLASAFGGGGGGSEELSYVEFAPGTSNLTADANKKLDTLAKALHDRPALKLEISGRVDPDSDREGTRHAYLDRQVRAQKIEDLRDQGSAVQMRDVTVAPNEYAKYLERAYKAEKFDKPRNVLGFAKSLPPEEMEKLMLANAPAGDAELKALADRRAQTVKRYLEQQGGVANERMFLTASQLSAAGIKDGGKPNRVEFAIKH